MVHQIVAKLLKERAFVIRYLIFAAVLGLILSFLVPARYTSTARIIPPQQQQTPLGSILAQLGAIGLAGLGGLRNPSELYVHLLRSDTVATALVQRFALEKHYGMKQLEDIQDKLESRTQIRTGRDGVVIIRVIDRDATIAASLANGYVEELQKLVQRLTTEEAIQKRRFLESKLFEVRKSLENAEMAFRALQETTGAIKIDGQLEGTFAAMGQLRANIAMREVTLRGLATSVTRQNPTYQTVEAELAELKAHLQKLEQSPNVQNPQFVIAAGQAPKLGMEYVRKLRDVKYEEAMSQVVLRQYELARMEEARDFQHFQVVDVARPATRRNFPSELLIVFSTVMTVLCVAIYLVLTDRIWYPSDLWKRGQENYKIREKPPRA